MPGSKVIEIHRRRGGSTDVRYNRAEWVWIRDSDRTAVDPNRSHAPTRAHWSAMPELLTSTYRLHIDGSHPLGRTIIVMQKFEYEIPDLDHPYPAEQVGSMSASGPLMPFVPERLDPSTVIGRVIEEWKPYVGTYGMGGPGFLGFRFGSDWLTIAIWGAGDWLRLEGRLVSDMFWEEHQRSMPWEADPNVDFDNLFVGRRFTALEIARDSLTAKFDDGRVLTLSPDPADRPHMVGNGGARSIGPTTICVRSFSWLQPQRFGSSTRAPTTGCGRHRRTRACHPRAATDRSTLRIERLAVEHRPPVTSWA